jgi:hypothetical protein
MCHMNRITALTRQPTPSALMVEYTLQVWFSIKEKHPL